MPQYISNVKEYREQEGWSQEALARELGVSRQTIVNIEKGISEPRVLLAIALAATLGVAIEQLFRKEPRHDDIRHHCPHKCAPCPPVLPRTDAAEA
jgi:putative transcriptional regulator